MFKDRQHIAKNKEKIEYRDVKFFIVTIFQFLDQVQYFERIFVIEHKLCI